MIFYGTIKDGKLVLNNQEAFDKFSLIFKEGDIVELEMKKEIKERTDKQNKALHLWFNILSKALNEGGFDMRTIIDSKIDIFWTPFTVKEHLWRPVQKAVLGKDSTKNLTTDEIDKVFDPINKVIGERTGIHVPFPSIENLYNSLRGEE